jgi:hypothetical protein
VLWIRRKGLGTYGVSEFAGAAEIYVHTHSSWFTTMASRQFLTRDEFLSHTVKQLPLPKNPSYGSPTKSTTHRPWDEMRDWDFESEARDYWNRLPEEDKTTEMNMVQTLFWGAKQADLDINFRNVRNEMSLRFLLTPRSQVPSTGRSKAPLTSTHKSVLAAT